MRVIFGFVSLILIHALALGQAAALGSDGDPSNGHITTDVTVRTRPQDKSPPIIDLEAGTAVQILAGKSGGWVRIVKPSGWIPSRAISLDSGQRGAGRDRNDSQERPRRRRGRDDLGGSGPSGSSSPTDVTDLGKAKANSPKSPQGERSESELMFEALTAARGESPNAARIARVVEQTSLETKRNQEKASILPYVWKDPFAEDSAPPVVVQPRRSRGGRSFVSVAPAAEWATPADSPSSELEAARRATVQARAEAASARAEAVAARAVAARAKKELSRQEAVAARAGCADALAPNHRPPPLPRKEGWAEGSVHDASGAPDRARRSAQRTETLIATARPSAKTRVGTSDDRTLRTLRTSVDQGPGTRPKGSEIDAVTGLAPSQATTRTSGAAVTGPPIPSGASPQAKNGTWTRGILVVPITPINGSR